MPVWPLEVMAKDPVGPIFSATNMLVALSSSKPPNSSGISTRSRPSLAQRRIFSTTSAKSCSSIRSRSGKISLLTKASVVAAICCCSEVKSSGVNRFFLTAAVNRNSPPSAVCLFVITLKSLTRLSDLTDRSERLDVLAACRTN